MVRCLFVIFGIFEKGLFLVAFSKPKLPTPTPLVVYPPPGADFSPSGQYLSAIQHTPQTVEIIQLLKPYLYIEHRNTPPRPRKQPQDSHQQPDTTNDKPRRTSRHTAPQDATHRALFQHKTDREPAHARHH